jgi:dephospho-CoA kinase
MARSTAMRCVLWCSATPRRAPNSKPSSTRWWPQHAGGAQAFEAAGTRVLVYDIPLLVESRRWPAELDAVVVVDCLPETQIARVQQRSGLSREAIDAIMATQASRAQRLQAADAVIFNEGCSLPDLGAQVAELATYFGL